MERIKINIQRFADKEISVSVTSETTKFTKSMKDAEKSVKSLKKTVSNVASGIKMAFDSIDLTKAFNSVKKLGTVLYSDFLTKAIDTSEELNLFNVVFNNIEKNGKTTFSELGKQATKFQNQLNEAFGTNKKETMRYQGLFQAMGESAGLDDKTAALMSENMTKLAYDLASLYNTTETKAAESLRAGVYAGQTKPLRNYGIDVTQTSYKPLLQELGIEKSVSELTQAEKEILRYISTLRQAKNAMGDFANTIESPANQLKVLRQQFYEMQAAIGNLFIGAFAKILPYVNAIIMVIKELAKVIASFFGIRMKDYNTGIASYADDLGAYSDGLDGIADSASGASNAIKALKRQTLGFDQINNLTSPVPTSGSGGSGGGGVAGGIDKRLLEALYGYDNGMDKVRMKALDIRDAIMDWLGFTIQVDEETGEVTWKLKDSNSTVGKIIQSLKDIVTYGKQAIKNVFRIIKDDFDSGGFGKIIVGAFQSIAGLLKVIAKNEVAAQIVTKIIEAILLFKGAEIVLNPVIKKFQTLGKVISTITGVGGAGGIGNKFGGMTGITQTITKTFSVPDVKTVLKGLADVAIVIAGVSTIITAIGLLTKIPGFNEVISSGIKSVKEVFKGLWEIMLPLGVLTAGMTVLGLAGGYGVAAVALGLADLAIVIVGTEAVILAAGAIEKAGGSFISSGIDTMKKVILGIYDILLPIGLLSAGLMVAGLAGGYGAAAIAIGIADLAIVILGTSAVVAAAGALTKIDGFTWLIGEGISLLKKLFKGVGEIAGSLVAGFIGVSLSGMADAGTQLANFMTNAQPFFDGASRINKGITEGVANIAAAMLIFTSTEIIDSLTSWFTGGVSLEKFGRELVAFAPYFKQYADIVSGINPDVVTGSSIAAKSIMEFAKETPNEGGVAAFFAGENNLATFSQYLPEFGKNLKAFGDAVAGLDGDVVKNAADAAGAVVAMSKKVPNQGGMAAWFAGDNKLGDYSAYLPKFGKNLKKFADEVAGLDPNVITNTANAAKALVEVTKQIPNQGGVASWFAGENKIDTFSSYLPKFGKNMAEYSKNVSGLDPKVITNSANAAKSIAEMAKNLPNSGGVASWFAGDNKLSDFGADLAKFGASFKKYSDSIKEIAIDKVNAVTSSIKDLVTEFKRVKDNKLNSTIEDFGKALKNSSGDINSFFNNTFSSSTGWNMGYSFGANIASGIKRGIKDYIGTTLKITENGSTVKSFNIKANALGGVFANNQWQPIQAYANGGVPSGGQLFMAREAGPELVGRIGRHTAVMNNNQIVDSVKAGVYEAVSAAMGNANMGGIEIVAHTDEGVVIDRINRITRQTGECPIDI